MECHEIRDLDEARQFLLQGFCLQRVAAPGRASFPQVFEWALEVASAGQPLPPIGFLADLGHLALRLDHPAREMESPAGLPAGLVRSYDDYVLGKLYGDWTFERAGDALTRYRPGRDRARGLAFLLNQFRERADLGGVLMSPAVIRGLLSGPVDDALSQGWNDLTAGRLHPLLPPLYESLITACRQLAEVLSPEDLFELEHGTALAEMGQRVALRQVLQASLTLEGELPRHRPRLSAHHREVQTRVLDEDIYPVGGYSSLSNRGTIESLLHSQLAYMEKAERPDLFDIKYLRDELLYYSRDENQFLRRRRTFVFALFPDLVQTRFKDVDLPWQRGILILGLLIAAVRRLSTWLSTEALQFDFLLLDDGSAAGLDKEQDLLQTVLREAIANGTVRIQQLPVGELPRFCLQAARRSLCHALLLSTRRQKLAAQEVVTAEMVVDRPCPALYLEDKTVDVPSGETPLVGWSAALETLLNAWI